MSSPKKRVKQEEPGLTAGPRASRPLTPGPDYGVARSEKGLLPWSHVTERMEAAKVYWVATVGPGSRPHATPVDGIWLDGALYFGGGPAARRSRNLAANPAACVHLENGFDVVILHGEARELHSADPALGARLYEISMQKYGYGTRPEGSGSALPGVFEFRPRVVFAWKEFPKDVTRWRFP